MNIFLKLVQFFLIFFTLFFVSTKVISQVYKWVDENGKIHYSDKPFDEKSKKVEMKSGPTQQQIIEARKTASRIIKHKNKVSEIIEDEASDTRKSKAMLEQQESKRKRECAQAKYEVRMLGRGLRSYTQDKDGNKHFLSDKEKEDRIAKWQEFINQNCNGVKD